MPHLSAAALATKPLKKFNNYKPGTFPYKILRAPVLRDHVSNRNERKKVAPCLEEMGLMLACWKQNNFAQNVCQKEIKQFDECFTNATETARRQKEAAGLDTALPGSRRLTYKQVNKLLARYPQPCVDYKILDDL